ncbi:hypothetical protein [Streptomyces sp. NPDC020377]|uniref:aromatic-ring hydroxylase C-terminal domain-containing protein n=1 Tax=Streptomyces sp. NPDC020377 TaxID=3365070 RepID=UPI0037B2864C
MSPRAQGRRVPCSCHRPLRAWLLLKRCGPATGCESRIRHVSGPARSDLGCGAVLVRPDGMVAWAGDRAPDREAFTRAAVHWFGGPAV